MARFGYLYLNDGVWDGRQVVPAEWVSASVGDRVEFDDGWGYGYQWWIYPSFDAYSAIGLDAQLIVVIPDLEMVVVFTAALDDADALFELIESFILSAAQSSRSLRRWSTTGILIPYREFNLKPEKSSSRKRSWKELSNVWDARCCSNLSAKSALRVREKRENGTCG